MNERVKDILTNPRTTHSGVGILTLGGGVGLGYILWGRKQVEETVIEDEIGVDFDFDTEGLVEARESVKLILDANDYATATYVPETTADISGDSVIVSSPNGKVKEDIPEPVHVNVFDDNDWDWEKELENRSEDKPYVLHRDEYYQNEHNFTQSTLVYYRGDDMMADESDQPILNYEEITGPLMFGHGSGDPDVVLIRNPRRRAEYEIGLHEGRYETEVLGIAYENEESARDLKHSRAPGRFRMD